MPPALAIAAPAPQAPSPSRAQVVAALREHLAQVAPVRTLPVGLPTGIGALEAATGGWPRPGVTLIQGAPGSGRLAPVLPTLARLTCAGHRIAVVDPTGLLHPPGLRGVLLDNLLLLRPGPTRVTWAVEQVARCDAIPLVLVLDPPTLGRGAARLQRAAEAGNSAVIVISDQSQRRLPAALRLATGRPGCVQLLRGGRGKGVGGQRWLRLGQPTTAPLEARAFPFSPGAGALRRR